jgi:hypothetical protein
VIGLKRKNRAGSAGFLQVCPHRHGSKEVTLFQWKDFATRVKFAELIADKKNCLDFSIRKS